MPPRTSARPTVAIVGRPNVGKSALFNRFAGRRISIVHDQPGVTRDRIIAPCTRGPLPFEVVDTGGIGSEIGDGFTDQVRIEADIAIHSADLIIFLVDGQSGINPVDHELARVLRKANVETILAVNKVDHDKHANAVTDFAEMGFENPFPISAEHGRNFDEFLRHICNRLLKRFALPDEPLEPVSPEEAKQRAVCIAIVGRPNVGKSSLINAVLEDERTIVSPVAGTTRDSVDVPYERGGSHYTLIDTAGIRKRSKQDNSVEVFSIMRSERSIRRSDLCLLVIDASAGVSAMDRKIAQMIVEENKACIIVLNKVDLFHPGASFKERMEELTEMIRRELFFLPYAPLAVVSALKGQHLNKIFGAIQKVQKAGAENFGTGALNRVLRDAVLRNPAPVRKSRKLNLLYVTTQKSERPRPIEPPKFLLFVNYADLLTQTYERYLENVLREKYDLTGLPVHFEVRSRKQTGGQS